MRLLTLPRPPARGRSRSPRRRPVFRALLAVMALSALSLIGVRSAAFAAGSAPFGGTAAAVPGTIQAANYDTGGQGTAYNVTSVNGSANSYRSDGVDLEACT